KPTTEISEYCLFYNSAIQANSHTCIFFLLFATVSDFTILPAKFWFSRNIVVLLNNAIALSSTSLTYCCHSLILFLQENERYVNNRFYDINNSHVFKCSIAYNRFVAFSPDYVTFHPCKMSNCIINFHPSNNS